jgi:3-hydroxyisobutyrate dehydrogenase
MARITVLGLGAVGSRTAGLLLKAGHEVTVWNRDAGKYSSLVTQGAIPALSAFSLMEKSGCLYEWRRERNWGRTFST